MPSILDLPSFSAELFFPRRTEPDPPPGAVDFRVEVAPSVRLHGRWHRGPEPRPVVLLFHGNGEVVDDYDGFAPLYRRRAGADLAVVDYRGYGASDGEPSLRACIDDAHRVLAHVAALVAPGPLVVMGRSLGGACAAELCQAPRPGVAGFIFESAPSDLVALVRRRGVEPPDPLPEADLDKFCPLRKARRCTSPALVLHGREDHLIVPAEAQATFEALRGEKRLVMLEGVGHNNISVHPGYWQALAGFIASIAPG